jgi:3-hydroxyisobutyrate dehydrogenase-like beta-hydroxyacid dehydrogenase
LPTHTDALSIGWIGTGRMGYEMAARLAKGGADVLAWNRTRAKADPLAQYGAKIATIWPSSRRATSSSAWCRRGTTSSR